MGLIKGITIKLYEKGGDAISINNVLVTPRSMKQDGIADQNLGDIVPDYTIAIPKGDTSRWLGGRAEFFGERWEIIALSGMTIDHLTPLAWNRRAYAIREMADIVTLRTERGRTRNSDGIYQTEYRDVDVEVLAHPELSGSRYEADHDGSQKKRRIIARQSDFDDAGVSVDGRWHEPRRAVLGGKEYEITGYERIGEVIMTLELTTEE